MAVLARAAAALYALGWEARRRAYAAGLRVPRRVGARVVSVGNLTLGGTGKTTLTLHLARTALEAGRDVAVVCRDYRPGPAGAGDEALLYRGALGERHVFSGRRKVELAVRAAARGHDPILVDDGFSHWALERDLDLVLLDAHDPWGGGALLPLGRLREPRRALQRAEVLVVSQLEPGWSPHALFDQVRRYAPAAWLAGGRHRVEGVWNLEGRPMEARGAAHLVTATGNPAAVARSAREAGFAPVTSSTYRDHHWFSGSEARRELARAEREGASLLLTAKDAIRWPAEARDGRVRVLRVAWEWTMGGDEVVRRVLDPAVRGTGR